MLTLHSVPVCETTFTTSSVGRLTMQPCQNVRMQRQSTKAARTRKRAGTPGRFSDRARTHASAPTRHAWGHVRAAGLGRASLCAHTLAGLHTTRTALGRVGVGLGGVGHFLPVAARLWALRVRTQRRDRAVSMQAHMLAHNAQCKGPYARFPRAGVRALHTGTSRTMRGYQPTGLPAYIPHYARLPALQGLPCVPTHMHFVCVKH